MYESHDHRVVHSNDPVQFDLMESDERSVVGVPTDDLIQRITQWRWGLASGVGALTRDARRLRPASGMGARSAAGLLERFLEGGDGAGIEISGDAGHIPGSLLYSTGSICDVAGDGHSGDGGTVS